MPWNRLKAAVRGASTGSLFVKPVNTYLQDGSTALLAAQPTKWEHRTSFAAALGKMLQDWAAELGGAISATR